ncbi:MAG: hypothetical protein GX904_04960 [Acholeplasmataceae bacterium]|nr:hypothetical protein [Acholeplasmataceae bacterium]
MEKSRFKYMIIPFTIVIIMQIISYWGNQWYSEVQGIVGDDLSWILLKVNQAVPFIPWTIYIYVLAFPFWVGCFFYIGYRSRRNLAFLMLLIMITFTITGLIYFFFQTDVQAWRETSGLFTRNDLNFTESFVFWIYNSAGARNANPSMHCLMSWLCILGTRMDKEMPKWIKIGIIVFAFLICVSTQTLKQHYIIDFISAVVLAEGFYWLLRKSNAIDKVQQLFLKINVRLGLDSFEENTQ